MDTSSNRDHPMFFRGEQQSEEFARGAWAATDLAAEVAAHDARKVTSAEVTAAMAGQFCEVITHQSEEFRRGFITAIVEFLAFGDIVGAPNFDVWRPLQMDLQFKRSGAHPTPGSELYEYAGAAVAIAPDQTVHRWDNRNEYDIERSKRFLDSVKQRGRPISRRAFDRLRGRGEDQLVA